GHFGQVAVALDRALPGVAWAFEVATVQHVHAAGSQRLAQPRDTQRLRPQPCAAVAGTDVGGRANDRNGGMDAAHGSLLDLVPAVGTKYSRQPTVSIGLFIAACGLVPPKMPPICTRWASRDQASVSRRHCYFALFYGRNPRASRSNGLARCGVRHASSQSALADTVPRLASEAKR